MSKKEKVMSGLDEQLTAHGIVSKSISELHIDFTLPPPIYGYHLTTRVERTNKQIKLVSELNRHKDGIEVVSTEGNRYVIAHSSVKYYVEE